MVHVGLVIMVIDSICIVHRAAHSGRYSVPWSGVVLSSWWRRLCLWERWYVRPLHCAVMQLMRIF